MEGTQQPQPQQMGPLLDRIMTRLEVIDKLGEAQAKLMSRLDILESSLDAAFKETEAAVVEEDVVVVCSVDRSLSMAAPSRFHRERSFDPSEIAERQIQPLSEQRIRAVQPAWDNVVVVADADITGDCDETVPEDYLDIDLSTSSLRPGGKLAPVATCVNHEGFAQDFYTSVGNRFASLGKGGVPDIGFSRFNDLKDFYADEKSLEEAFYQQVEGMGSSQLRITLDSRMNRRKTGVVPQQKYDDIKAECLSSGSLWEDPEFPAIDSSLFYSQRPPRAIEWKRPSEICDNPRLFVGGASRFDIEQGELGDCWLLAATASLTINQDSLHKVVPPNQSFIEDYAGIFKFRFWRFGKWIEVCVDDRLPTYRNQLVFLHSAENNEFWTALLEKAYAKLVGSYEALKGGNTTEAMEDFTGGVTEVFDLRKAPPDLFKVMKKGCDRSSLMGCSLDTGVVEGVQANGLISGHAYSVTNVATATVTLPGRGTTAEIPLVRVRNPWGNEAEWKGAWSDGSREWGLLSEEDKQALGISFDHDGEFWMAYTDFINGFTKLEICSLGPDAMVDPGQTMRGGAKRHFECMQEDGSWTRHVSAGGCRNFPDSFWTNPQIRITLEDPDEDDDEDLCTCVVALMQKDRRKQRQQGVQLLTTGFAIYKLGAEDMKSDTLDKDWFRYHKSSGMSTFINTREVTARFKLSPGTYVVIPSTFKPNEQADFLLRVFSEKPGKAQILDDTTGEADISGYGLAFGNDDGPRPMPNKQPAEVSLDTMKLDDISDPTMPKSPEVDERQREILAQFFKKISGDDMEVDAFELQEVLTYILKKEFQFDGFSMETAKSMVAMMDIDLSGKLGFDEFSLLWNDLRLWKTIFKQYDTDKSGTFDAFELRRALRSSGYRLSTDVFKALVFRYGNREGKITFDNYIQCSVKLKSMMENFRSHQSRGGAASYDLDDFMQTTLYS